MSHAPGIGDADGNLAALFVRAASAQPDRMALALQRRNGRVQEMTFRELDARSSGYARGLRGAGLEPGDRVLLLMRPGVEFIALVLGLLRGGLVVVLVDPGMDRPTLLRCIARAAPVAMIGAPAAQALATLAPASFASVRRRWLSGWPWAPGAIERVRDGASAPFPCATLDPGATAAIVFTTGSTGVPKGVVYTHAHYLAQVALLRQRFAIDAGEPALPGYLPFTILCLCLGSACAVPRVDPARPGSVDPIQVLDLLKRHRPVYGLGSPAFWGRVGEHCARTGERLESLRLLLLFGAEVDESILRCLRAALPGRAEIHTPYGATEAQPITTISDRDLLNPAMLALRATRGVCVGTPFEGVDVRLVRITDDPLDELDDRLTMTAGGEVGEVVVRGAAVTSSYFDQPEQDRRHKIVFAADRWHRMGDCGSIDEHGRLWLAGRKAHRIDTAAGLIFPLPVESRANRHPSVRRSALVGVGAPGRQRPVLVVELIESAHRDGHRAAAELRAIMASDPATASVRDVLVHARLPVDYRHNAKIQRDRLGRWAAGRIADI